MPTIPTIPTILHALYTHHLKVREQRQELAKVSRQLEARQLKLVSHLRSIYPIDTPKDLMLAGAV
jgi:hypothetical protein